MNASIRNFFLSVGIIFFILLSTVLYAVFQLKEKTYELIQFDESRSTMVLYADMLRQSSDDLTKYARLYVVTADEQYKKDYYTILDIRNGDKKRPLRYENVYWDLLEPLRSKRHPLEKKGSLKEIFKSLPYDAYEYQKLHLTEANSNTLTQLEIEAFNAMIGLYKDENGHYS